MKHIAALRNLLIFLLFCAVLAGCTPPAQLQPAASEERPLFRPPTAAAPTPTAEDLPTELPAAADQANQSGVSCADNLTFVSDLTIPDGTRVAPQSTMDKRWEVENSSSCNWNESYRVRLIAGPELGAQKEQSLYPARSGTRAAIRILFQAPVEPGPYRSAWQAFNPQGEPFGDPFFIDFTVGENP